MRFIIKKIILCIQILLVNITFKFCPKKQQKIIIGVTEIANFLYNLKSLFNEECITVCKNRNTYYKNNKYDFDITKEIRIIKFIFSAILLGLLAKNSNFFIYLWTDGFLLNREADFKFLKRHNIPIICCFLGDDIRSRKLFLDFCKRKNFNTYVEYDKPDFFLSDIYDNEKKSIAEQADKYASIIFSHKTDQYSYIQSEQYFFPPVINEKIFSFNIEKFNRKPFKIVHAPSLPVLKGTPLVRSVVKQLIRKGYEFQYVELINKPNTDVIKELIQSHIVLNQFYTFIPGIFGLEAMATGNAVLMSAKSKYFPYKFNDAWIETEDWQLYENLKYLLDHPNKIFEYAKKGYEYITTNFSSTAIRLYLKNIFIQNEIYTGH
jgi:hypothetical protein